MKPLNETAAWKALAQHAQSVAYLSADDFQEDVKRNQRFQVAANGITLNYSGQRILPRTLELLFDLANERLLYEKTQQLLRGEKINVTEDRAALHTALRASHHNNLLNPTLLAEVVATRQQMRVIAQQLRAGEWRGYQNQAITDIINIGIGGSDLGPRFCLHALAPLTCESLRYHFISDADPAAFAHATSMLNPATTLFIVASKSFTTPETIYNLQKAKQWIGKSFENHFIAVTAHAEKARIHEIKHILPIWDWVGGRFSACSAINLISVIAIGMDAFEQLLAGAAGMDHHFLTANWQHNLPVLLALLGIWNNNFLNIHHLLILTYAQSLNYFVPYIQQLDMESNGKSLDLTGRLVNFSTGPIIWGGAGNQAQHSYYQLLCQGTHAITADFVTLNTYEKELINQYARHKMNILHQGIKHPDRPEGYVEGNHSFNHLQLNDCSAFTLGALIALYEHKIFTQSVIWGINAFDQPGVESSKRVKTQ